jgi:hypothetical protein
MEDLFVSVGFSIVTKKVDNQEYWGVTFALVIEGEMSEEYRMT